MDGGVARADCNHHSIIPRWIYRIPSELRSQASLGPISTAVGDHAGILGVECFFGPKDFEAEKNFGAEKSEKFFEQFFDAPKILKNVLICQNFF